MARLTRRGAPLRTLRGAARPQREEAPGPSYTAQVAADADTQLIVALSTVPVHNPSATRQRLINPLKD